MKKPKWKWHFYNSFFRWLPLIQKKKLRWKDKFGTPRCEWAPSIHIEWLWFALRGIRGDDDYWEQWLWIHYWHNEDVEKAKETWSWVDMETKESTWVDY